MDESSKFTTRSHRIPPFVPEVIFATVQNFAEIKMTCFILVIQYTSDILKLISKDF